MPLEILTIPCLTDNYAYIAHDGDTGETLVVDVPEAAPVMTALAQRGWTLSHVFLTHHHADHVDGLDLLLKTHPAKVIGAAADAHRLAALDLAVREGDYISIGSYRGEIIDVSGHTLGHIALHFPEAKAAFTADSLMALGCGRLFEGSPQLMFESLTKLAALPAQTWIYSGHEYTASNLKFALSIEPENARLISRGEKITVARQADRPTVPELLSEELATNPFLRSHTTEVRKAVGMEHAEDWQVFAKIRTLKDGF